MENEEREKWFHCVVCDAEGARVTRFFPLRKLSRSRET